MPQELLTIHRSTTLPGTPAAKSLYFVKGSEADLLEIVMVSTDGTEVRHIITKSEISTLIDTKIAANDNAQNSAIAVADIAARDALTLTASRFVMVTDATADATVDVGAAMYFWDDDASTWTKIYEAEGMELVLDWASLQNKPTSTVVQIDQAVADMHTHAKTDAELSTAVDNSHTHTNKTTIDKFTEDGNGDIKYDGEFLKTYVESDW